MEIKFDKDLSAVELNNDESKIVNVYIVYDLDGQDILVTISNLGTVHLEGTASVVKNIDKERYVYSGYRITFDSAGSWSLDNEITINFINFGADESSSTYGNPRNNFSVLVEGHILEIIGRSGSPKKKNGINFGKANTVSVIKIKPFCNIIKLFLHFSPFKVFCPYLQNSWNCYMVSKYWLKFNV